MLLVLGTHFDWEIHQMDIKSAYLLGEDLDEEIYMWQPPGFIHRDKKEMVFRLLKLLYRLKQASQSWNRKIHQLLTNLGFKQL